MGSTHINIRIDADLKRQCELLYGDVPNDDTIQAIYEVKRMKGDSGIGKTYTDVDQMMEELLSDVQSEVDPFYSESNIRHLENIMQDIKDGKAHFAEHDLIEVD